MEIILSILEMVVCINDVGRHYVLPTSFFWLQIKTDIYFPGFLRYILTIGKLDDMEVFILYNRLLIWTAVLKKVITLLPTGKMLPVLALKVFPEK